MAKYQIFSKQEKWSIMKRVESSLNKERELAKLGISHSTYYGWRQSGGETQSKAPHRVWNTTPKEIEKKIEEYRKSADPLKQSPARIMENLERNDSYLMSESGVKSVLVRLKLNGFLRLHKKRYYIRPKAEKFLEVVSLDDVEFIRYKPRDTYVLNFTDEASYFALESKVRGHKTNSYHIIQGLKRIRQNYGRYPKRIRLDNAQAHKATRVSVFCKRNNIHIDFITKGCPEENWPVESWHRNLNQDVIYRHGYETIGEWQKAINEYRYFHNHLKRHRADPIQRTPAEIAFAFTTHLTQARLKLRFQRKQWGQTSVQKFVQKESRLQLPKTPYFSTLSVSEMCVS